MRVLDRDRMVSIMAKAIYESNDQKPIESLAPEEREALLDGVLKGIEVALGEFERDLLETVDRRIFRQLRDERAQSDRRYARR